MAIVMMLKCQSTTPSPENSEQGNIHLTGVADQEGEYKEFFAYTPYAELRAGILNPAAFGQITPGKTYKLTLEQVD